MALENIPTADPTDFLNNQQQQQEQPPRRLASSEGSIDLNRESRLEQQQQQYNSTFAVQALKWNGEGVVAANPTANPAVNG